MNATEDGSPLGEHIDTLDAIQRGAVLGVLSAADEVLAVKQLAERQTEALNKVRELHQPFGYAGTCHECSYTPAGVYVLHPCPTIRAINSAGA